MDDKNFEGMLDDVTKHFRHIHLRDWWDNLCSNADMPYDWAVGVYYLIQKFYILPKGYRHYHTLVGHVHDCLAELYSFKEANPNYTTEWFAVEFAIWMHDVFYIAGSIDNEIESSKLAHTLLFGTPQESSADLCELIIVDTANALPPHNACFTIESELVCDIDLVGMGGTYEQFIRNGQAIRQEFKDFPDDVFNPGRLNFMTTLQSRGYVYRLSYFKDRYEKNAQENIARFIEEAQNVHN